MLLGTQRARVLSVAQTPAPDKVLLECRFDGEEMPRRIPLLRDADIPEAGTGGSVEIDRDAIVAMVVRGIDRQLQKGLEHYGTATYDGEDPLGQAFEELVDAIIYLWFLRRRIK